MGFGRLENSSPLGTCDFQSNGRCGDGNPIEILHFMVLMAGLARWFEAGQCAPWWQAIRDFGGCKIVRWSMMNPSCTLCFCPYESGIESGYEREHWIFSYSRRWRWAWWFMCYSGYSKWANTKNRHTEIRNFIVCHRVAANFLLKCVQINLYYAVPIKMSKMSNETGNLA